MFNSIKKIVPNVVRQVLKRRLFHHRDVFSVLSNMKRCGYDPRGIVDGGAFEGKFILDVWKLWKVPALIVEPQPSKKAVLEMIARRVPGSMHIPCALGRETGRVQFACDESNSRVVDTTEGIEVKMVTLDELLDSQNDFCPDLLKLDLQGNELNALTGAVQTLQRFELILLEVSVIRIGPVPIFHEVQDFMNNSGFRFYDVVPQYYRPRDNALWQMDVFYVRKNSKLLESDNWS